MKGRRSSSAVNASKVAAASPRSAQRLSRGDAKRLPLDRAEAGQLVASIESPELARRLAEVPPELARQHGRRREAAGRCHLFDGNVAIEEKIACGLKPDLDVALHRRVVVAGANDALELAHRDAAIRRQRFRPERSVET